MLYSNHRQIIYQGHGATFSNTAHLEEPALRFRIFLITYNSSYLTQQKTAKKSLNKLEEEEKIQFDWRRLGDSAG